MAALAGRGIDIYQVDLTLVKPKEIPFRNRRLWNVSLAAVASKPPVKKSLFSPRYDGFLELLREARESAGLSQREAAKKLDRTQSYISKSESGERRVDVIELVDFLRVYGVRPGRFVERLDKEAEAAEVGSAKNGSPE